jgi:hypothetical protein
MYIANESAQRKPLSEASLHTHQLLSAMRGKKSFRMLTRLPLAGSPFTGSVQVLNELSASYPG